ncbi:MAG TPA: histidine kinase dimerization/phospho-acceptor domain-containing protein [Candidatus Acidoferrales bacterium]|nr:histidine kinase dimerization/phospho-acceptor domain-containing protein [Candidatus Acidoferrales bacterium]
MVVNTRRGPLSMVLIGLALAAGDVYLAVIHPSGMFPNIGFLPELYGAGVAAYLFRRMSREGSPRERSFWKLWAAGCALWMASDAIGMIPLPTAQHRQTQFLPLAFTFIPRVVMMTALVLQPEVAEGELRDPVVRSEAGLLGLWWFYLYLILVMPWHFISYDPQRYWPAFVHLHELQNGMTVAWLAALALLSRSRWRRVYAHLAVAFTLLALAIGPMHDNLDAARWVRAMSFEALVAGSFLWMALTAAIAPQPSADHSPSPARLPGLGTGRWLALLTALGIPLVAAWAQMASGAPAPVRHFRLYVSFAALIAGTTLVYKRQDVADEQRERLVASLETSVQELRRLQGQFAEAEKLASLGQLAAGAAHEINNPVAAILGYSELVRADASATERSRELARKVGDQARRIRTLVHNVLSLAQQAPREQGRVDAAALARSAVELRQLGGMRMKTNLRFSAEAAPLEVRGNSDKLLQVFYGLLAALSEPGDDKGVEVMTRAARRGDRVIVEFVRTAPEISSTPARQIAYDAAPAVRGQALELGVCQAIVREHGGSIVPETLPSGARIFRIELPALPSTEATAVPAVAAEPS